ncbi:MAG: hypothetical protein AB7W47_09140 [Calditrichaceae bacterium]
MAGIFNRKHFTAVILAISFILAGCAGIQQTVSLEPGSQVNEAEIDLQSGSVTQRMEDIEVTVQAAMLPEPYGEIIHPTFWITVQNNRETKISIKPAQTRLIDSFGNQLKPLTMTFGEKTETNGEYVIVDPEIHYYFGMNYGWSYYPMYPYRAWHKGRGTRIGIRHAKHDPFWDFGPNVVWVKKLKKSKETDNKPEKEETIYHHAKLTYVVTFPELKEKVKEVRLMVPDVSAIEGDRLNTLDFELVFNQIIKVEEK